MKRRLPDYDEVITAAVHITGQSHHDIDIAAMRSRIHAGLEAILKELAAKLNELTWSDICVVLGRHDYTPALLSDYLSTCGASGVVANDKLGEVMAESIPAMLADEVRRGNFVSPNASDPVQLARIIGSAGVNSPSGEPAVTLTNPGGAETDLPQLGYQLFTACGLTVLAFGRIPLEDLAGLLLHSAPAFRATEVRSNGIGVLAGHDDKLWMGFEGPVGSVIAYFGASGGEFVQNQVLQPISSLSHPAQWGVGTVGARVPAAAAEILDSARPVALWRLSQFADQRPAEDLTVPASLAAALQAQGWQPLDGGGFKFDVPLRRGGSQAVFFTPYDPTTFAVIAPLDSAINGQIPEAMRDSDFGHYSLEIVADMIVLCERFPLAPQPPDPRTITESGIAVTLFAEQQFRAPAAVSAPPPTSIAGSTLRAESGGKPSGTSVVKGGNVSLSRQAPDLGAVRIGLGWDVNAGSGAAYDIDASAIACGENRKVVSDRHFVFFNNLNSPEGSIVHQGDNHTGKGEGDDETIDVELSAVPAEVSHIFFVVSIHDAAVKGQSFGQVRNAFIRIVNRSSGHELARFDLTDDAAGETAMVFGEVYRRANEWKFRAIGQGYDSGLAGIAKDFGVNIG